MSNILRIVSEPVYCVLWFSSRCAVRLALCVLLTALDVGVTVLFGGTLYRATAIHPIWFVGVSLLFGVLLASLIRVW